MLILLTGEIGTGKTTRLKNWSEKNSEFKGILQLNINDKRFLYNVSSGETRELTADNSSNPIKIGKYKFDADVMEWGINILENLSSEDYPRIIVDEYGKLEMVDKGLEPTIGKLVKKSLTESLSLILVIRKNLLDAFLRKYSISEDDFKYFEDVYEN